jgi:hypothetical protein
VLNTTDYECTTRSDFLASSFSISPHDVHVLEQGRKRELAIQAVKSGKTLQQFRIGRRVSSALRLVERAIFECFGVRLLPCLRLPGSMTDI